MKLSGRHFVLLLIACLTIAGYFWPGELWGFSNPFFMPLGLQIAYWGLFLALFFSENLDFVSFLLDKISKSLFCKSSFCRTFWVFVIGTAFLYFFRSQSFLWGDSHLFTGIIVKFPETESLSWYHIPTAFIHRIALGVLSWILPNPTQTAAGSSATILEYFNATLGGIFVAMAYRFAGKLKGDTFRKLLVFIGLAFSGGFLLFTHLEFYSLPYLVGFTGLTEFYLSIRDGKKPKLAYLLIVASVLLNPLLAFLLLTATAFVGEKHYSKIIVGISLVGMLIYYAGGFFFNLPFGEKLLLYANPSHFGDGTYWLNLLGFLFIASPAVALIFMKRDISRSADIFRWLALPAVLIVASLELDFGGLDWDFAVMMLLPLSLAGAFALFEAEKRTAVMFAMLITLTLSTWLYLNADTRRGRAKGEATLLAQQTAYFERKPHELRLAQIYYNNPRHRYNYDRIWFWANENIDKYGHLSMPYIYMISANRIAGNTQSASWFALQGYERADIDPWFISVVISLLVTTDAPQITRITSAVESEDGSLAEFVQFPVNKGFEREMIRLSDPEEPMPAEYTGGLTAALLAAAYVNYNSIVTDSMTTRKTYEGAVRLYSRTPSIHTNWGTAVLRYGRYDDAREAFEKARDLGGYIGNYYNNTASVCFAEGDYDCVFAYLDSAVAVEPMDFGFNRNYSAALFTLGQQDSAIAYMERYAARADYERADKARQYIEVLRDAIR